MVILWLRYGYVMVLSAKWPYIVRYLPRVYFVIGGHFNHRNRLQRYYFFFNCANLFG